MTEKITFTRGTTLMSESVAAALNADPELNTDAVDAAADFLSERLAEELKRVPGHQAADALIRLARQYPHTAKLAFRTSFTGAH